MSMLLSLLSELDMRMLEMMLGDQDKLGVRMPHLLLVSVLLLDLLSAIPLLFVVLKELSNYEDGSRKLSVFEISKCTEGKKVRFDVATLQGPALTWWNTKVATMGLETMNQMPWTEMKQLMTAEMVEPERVKVDAYIRGLTDNIKEMKEFWKERSESRRAFKVEMVVVREIKGITHAKLCRITKGNETRELSLKRCLLDHFLCVSVVLLAMLVSVRSSATSVERNRCPRKVKQDKVEEVHGRAYAIKDVKPKGLNVVTGTFLLNNRYTLVLFDSGSDRSFMDTRFSSMLNIDPVKIGASYEVELADGRVVSTNTVLKGCTLNLGNHVFEIDLMPIELGMFDIIIGMD
ncbi:putative reverse transcriptase domain-containing protein [Tanacetum coccineum]